MRTRVSAALAGLLTVTLVGGGLAGCQEPERRTVALLLGSERAARWTDVDEPTIRGRIEQACDGCELIVANAGGDAARQADQLDEALEDGADVVILNPVDSAGGEELVERAGDVPVVAYDRYVAGADWLVTVDAAEVGRLQATAVVRAVGSGGAALVINGGSDDPNAAQAARAARAVLDEGGVRVRAELNPPTWGAEEARSWVAKRLRPGRDPLRGVGAILVANDVQAGGVVEALQAARVPASSWPVITGQDAELAAVRRIVRGEQEMTVLKPLGAEATQAADIAVRLVTDEEITGATDYEGVASFVLEPQSVTVTNLTNTVVRQGVHSIEEICDAATMARCVALGIA